MKITADDLMRLSVIDEIVAEPVGGAHRDPQGRHQAVGEAVRHAYAALRQLDRDAIRRHRRDKFMAIGRMAG